jgi:hypothetical protein
MGFQNLVESVWPKLPPKFATGERQARAPGGKMPPVRRFCSRNAISGASI